MSSEIKNEFVDNNNVKTVTKNEEIVTTIKDTNNNNNEEKNIDHKIDNNECNELLLPRSILKSFKAKSQREGLGFIVNRPIGSANLSNEKSDPFLLLDELGPFDYKKEEFVGTDMHPHRGFDTVMYLKQGSNRHRDSMGNTGIINAGDIQWMTAGSGIIHEEGKDHPGGWLHGFQLWVNLPAKNKMMDPYYQQITGKHFPFIEFEKGVQCKIIAGKYDYNGNTYQSPIKTIVDIHYFDFFITKGHSFIYKMNDEVAKNLQTLIIYVYEGKGEFSDGTVININNNDNNNNNKEKWVKVERKSTLYYGIEGNCIQFKANDNENLGFLLLQGKPIRETIAWYGPFVMNTQDELIQAFDDYQNDKLAIKKGQSVTY